ncbi:hypothetical protein U1Q18_009827 [Sarracenia purpurea var. burkii]
MTGCSRAKVLLGGKYEARRWMTYGTSGVLYVSDAQSTSQTVGFRRELDCVGPLDKILLGCVRHLGGIRLQGLGGSFAANFSGSGPAGFFGGVGGQLEACIDFCFVTRLT